VRIWDQFDRKDVGPSKMKTIMRVLAIFFIAIVAIGLVAVTLYLLINRTNGQIVSSGERRRYLVYVPESYNPGLSTPLVINIHGFVQWPANQMRVSQWNAVADKHGFIVVYPSGTGFPLRWRVSDEPEKEIAFFVDLIAQLEGEYNIDASRIYANGLSNGGGMTLLLACRLSERITAVGTVAGAFQSTCEEDAQRRPVPAIFFHGKADPILPYAGGAYERTGIPFPNIPEFVAAYAQGNGCNPAPTTLMETGNVTGIRYSECNQDADVVFYTINDGGHTWPGGSPLPERITGKTSQEIDATGLMWEFFQEFLLAP
jgi:polyhydroxybutyrate depolymerase